MRDVLFDDIDLKAHTITDVYTEETSYDYFAVYCKIDGEECRILDTRNSRCSDMVFTDTSHAKGHAESLVKKLGGDVKEMSYRFNHNPNEWEEDIGEFDGYYGDGLDHIEELYEW